MKKNTPKLYPFSMSKYAHNLELARNYLYTHYVDKDGVDPKMEAWANDRRQRLGVILLKSNGYVAWLTGEEYALAQKASGWAQTLRVAANDEALAQRMERSK